MQRVHGHADDRFHRMRLRRCNLTENCAYLAIAARDAAEAWMALGRTIRRKARAAVAPAVFLLLVAYFASNALHGDHGLEAKARLEETLRQAQAEHARAEAEAAVWERRVAALRTRLDPDALDERARAQLDLSDPADVIVQYDKGQKLF
jgi:cell division protein FtsB